MQQFSRYHTIVSHLARQALAAAVAAGPEHDDEPSVGLAVPAAQRLLDVTPATPAERALAQLAAAPPRLVTFTGQSRAVYHPLAVHLHLRTLGKSGDVASCDAVRAAVTGYAPLSASREQLALTLWQALCLIEAADLLGDEAPPEAQQAIERLLNDAPGRALHAQHPDDSLDDWTYRELAALHALANVAAHRQDAALLERVAQAATFHLEHTQPDYTTYEPWAVYAFVRRTETVVFAEQQLHDVATNLRLSGDRAGLVAGLLLADAADAMRRENHHQNPKTG